MDPRQIDAAVDAHIPQLRVLALAFCASVAVYALVAWLLVALLDFGGIMELPFNVAAAIAAVQLLVILAGYLLSRAIRRPPDRSQAAGGASPRGASAGSRDARPGVETVPLATGESAAAAMQRYTKSVIVASALRELAVVVGFLLTLFTGDLTWVLLLGGIALISMLVHWPRRDAVYDFLQQQRLGY